MKDTMIQNAFAVVKMLEAIQKKYDLPYDELMKFAMSVYKENMKFDDE